MVNVGAVASEEDLLPQHKVPILKHNYSILIWALIPCCTTLCKFHIQILLFFLLNIKRESGIEKTRIRNATKNVSFDARRKALCFKASIVF